MQNEFQKLWNEKYSSIQKSGKGIKFVIGFPKEGKGSEVQSVLFNADDWSIPDAKVWLQEHDFKNFDVDQTENNLRFRQEDPGKYSRLRTITPGEKQRDFLDSTKDTFDSYEGGDGGNVDSSEQPHKPFKPGDKTPPTKKGIDFSDFTIKNKEGELIKTGGVPFKIIIEKACVSERGEIQTVIVKDSKGNVVSEEKLPEHMIVEGLASTTNVDHDEEKMAPEALKAMVDCIKNGGVQLRSEHSKDWDGKLGNVYDGWLDDRGQFHIKAELNRDMSKAVDLYRALKKGAQLGLSIAGVVKRAGLEMAEALGRKVKTFYDVLLKEVSVTNRPSNFDTWLVAKGLSKSSGVDFYKEYLTDNRFLDWQYSIAKSIPDEFLQESSQTNNKITNNNMNLKDLKEKAKSIALKSIDDAFKSMDDSESSDSTTDVADKTTETGETTDTKGGSSSESTADTSDYKPDSTTDTSETSDESKSAKAKDVKAKNVETITETKQTKKEDNGDSTTETDDGEDDSSDNSDDSSSSSTSKKFEMDTLINQMTDMFEKRLAEHDKRVVGPLKEMITKFLSEPNERKGIAFDKVIVEKNFGDNQEKKNETEELAKDIKDENTDFKGVFKKHLSTFKK